MARINPLYLDYWRLALDKELGIAITIDPPTAKEEFRLFMYDTRKALGGPELQELMLFSPNGPEVFVIKKATELPRDA